MSNTATVFKLDYTFVPTRVKPWSRLQRQRWWWRLTARQPMPPFQMVRPVFPAPQWTLLFIYLPAGGLQESQRFTLSQVRKLDRRLLIVCATAEPGQVPAELHEWADALYWKGLSGFDFSAYSIGLHAIADRSPSADVFVLNDSTFGPFGNVANVLERAAWDLTGFSGSHQYEDHIQSFAFMIRGVNPKRLRQLRSIFPMSFSYNDIMPVVLCFETRFARVASRKMTVGAIWFGPDDGTDPSITHAFELLDLGFPFLKKGLLGKHRDKHDEQKTRRALAGLGFPQGCSTLLEGP